MAKSSTSGQGRPKGLPNKSTAQAREAISRFVDLNAHRLERWLDRIEQEDGPKAAFTCFMDVVEYHIPKLARTEQNVNLNASEDLIEILNARKARAKAKE
jgi:hypothetical protein